MRDDVRKTSDACPSLSALNFTQRRGGAETYARAICRRFAPIVLLVASRAATNLPSSASPRLRVNQSRLER